jgi:ATP-dependent Clp protease protease subunit
LKRYYTMTTAKNEAEIYIFGDIIEPTEQELWGVDADVSGYSLIQDLKALGDVDTIHVHINSYGGHVSEALAIANTLKQHKAKVVTYCDGFACSAAAGVFMAGDERVMFPASLLMIHNVWSLAIGNADQLRKEADDLDIITQATIALYTDKIKITEERLKELMNAETWILPSEALEWGFATGVIKADETTKAAASARQALFLRVAKGAAQPEPNPEPQLDYKEMLEDLAKLLKQEKPNTAADPPPVNEPADPPAEPQENKVQKFITALFAGRKDDEND